MKSSFTLTVDRTSSLYNFLESQINRKFFRYLKSSSATFTVLGEPIIFESVVYKGEVVTITYTEKTSDLEWPVDSTPVLVLFQNWHFLICYKPHDILTIPTKHEETSLYQRLLHLLKDKPFKFLNRLDKPTSGLVLVGLDRYYTSLLAASFTSVKRSYYAICYGHVRNLDIEVLIGKAADGVKREVRTDGKLARTILDVIAVKGNFYFVRLTLLTGRTHQIRVSLAYNKIYILGDVVYSDQTYLNPFMCLESSYLEFRDPSRSEVIKVHYTELWQYFCSL